MEDRCDRTLQMLATAIEKEEKGRDFYKDGSPSVSMNLEKRYFARSWLRRGSIFNV